MRIWFGLGAVVLAEIGYPLTEGRARAALVVVTVCLGFALSVWHAYSTRGARAAGALVLVTTGGGLLVEAIGRSTGHPFGAYDYTGALGPRLLGVPVVIPLAWTWMAWPAWVAAGRLTARPLARVGVAGLGLAAWDLFLDPQMVSQRYWLWHTSTPALPGVPGIPLTNYLGWLGVAVALMALLRLALGDDPVRPGADAPMYAMYLWTYTSSIVAHGLFLGLPASAAWGAVGMGLVAVPLAVRLWRSS
ncbi:carotenoid biosynthesis protein [Dactylosporangium sp. NPDC051484]|uniref:carotenoid biosynthesis protein n=1 Tax=Dactylosporangium sp. NPDC051484 TaxID=3154942 RepID=UPI00344BBBD6